MDFFLVLKIHYIYSKQLLQRGHAFGSATPYFQNPLNYLYLKYLRASHLCELFGAFLASTEGPCVGKT
jgi:hypothetical protein